MKKLYIFFLGVVVLLVVPMLACGSIMSAQVTPTPTKTPNRIKILPTPMPTDTPVPTNTPIPPTDTPIPPTDTPVPTDTPIPPTETPVPTNTPPPPPTDTPIPPPTNTPAPPPPTQPPANDGPQGRVDLPDGNEYGSGDKIKMNIVVTDPDGVSVFTWGIFMQNKTPLMSDDVSCGGATECSKEVKAVAPVPGTYWVGIDAKDKTGKGYQGFVAEIYVH